MKLRSLLAQPLVLVALRLFTGIVFLYASVDKILHPAAFAETVANYHMVPYPLLNLFALLLPMLELVTGVLILAGIWSLEAATIALALLVSFIVALAQGMARGLDFHCGCFTQEGASTDPANWLTVLRDVGFVVAGVLLILAERRTATWTLLRDPLGKRGASY